MSTTGHARATAGWLAILLALPAYAGQTVQGPAPAAAPIPAPAQNAAAQGAGTRVTLDRVVAIVNGNLILLSDVDAERRFAAFTPFTEPTRATDSQLVDRLIDRELILEQMALEPDTRISDTAVDAELATLRKAIPKCAAYHCETEAGWEKFVADQGFTMQQMRDRWRERMQVLDFIEERFRMGIRISQAEIDDYYQKTMLPVYQKEGVNPPAEATLVDRIQEILLQEQVNKLLEDWLNALRAQGSVRILNPGKEAQ